MKLEIIVGSCGKRMVLSHEIIAILEKRKEELLNQPYTENNSRTVELIDIITGV